MTYHNAVKYIVKAPQEQADTAPGTRIRTLWDALDAPQRNLKYLRLIGNNGKTVCASMLVSAFKNSGHSIGCLVLPPHAEIRENILINGTPLSFDDFSLYVERVYKTVISINKENARANEKNRLLASEDAPVPESIPEIILTQHEILLTAALLAFRDHDCRLCIIESAHTSADPSRFLPSPMAAAICGTIPHTDQKELHRIRSYVCAGIQELVAAPEDRDSFESISEICAGVNCRLTIPTKSALEIVKVSLGGSDFFYKNRPYRLNVCGHFQIANAVITLEILDMLGRRGFPLSYDHIFEGLRHLKLPAKFEILSSSPAILADSAHSEVTFEAICRDLIGFRSMIGERIRLILPDGELIDQYANILTNQEFQLQGIYVLSEKGESRHSDTFPVCFFQKLRDLITAALSDLKQNEILMISGEYPFASLVRYELLSRLGF